MLVTDKYVFFWKESFSQWYMIDFVVDGIKYNCAEQYMMYQKAVLFDDDTAAELIMKAPYPRQQKGLGQGVNNFNQQVWDNNCYDIVFQGNYSKYTQTNTLKIKLLATEDRLLVEASPFDPIWGIGMAQDDPNVFDESKWGRNLLGIILTDVRNKIRTHK